MQAAQPRVGYTDLANMVRSVLLPDLVFGAGGVLVLP